MPGQKASAWERVKVISYSNRSSNVRSVGQETFACKQGGNNEHLIGAGNVGITQIDGSKLYFL